MISIIVPTLNESWFLGSTLQLIAENRTLHEVIICDGGSNDDTIQIANQYGARTLPCTRPVPCRATQMNSGAEAASGKTLLFLHADTHLRGTSLHQIELALQQPAVVGGGFERRFDSPSLFLRFSCQMATWRCRMFGWFLGDQAIFVRRAVFDQLKGFSDMPLFEDLEFSRRLSRIGKTVTLSPGIVCSGRRFLKRGPLLTTLHDFWLTYRYLNGSTNLPAE